MVTFALAKGRLADKAIEILEKAGVDCSDISSESRKLVFTDPTGNYRFLMVKPSDVPTYVDRGVADIGVVGKDTLMEANLPLYEMLDLGFGKCKLAIAGYANPNTTNRLHNKRVATKYVNIARNYFSAKNETIDIIKLNGSVELGPLVGLSDVILDIVESGSTLKANGLSVLEEICPISARLVVNKVSLKTKRAEILSVIDGMQAVMNEMKG